MRSSRLTVAAGIVAAVLIAGCASSISGSPQPNAAAVSALATTEQSTSDMPSTSDTPSTTDTPSTSDTPTTLSTSDTPTSDTPTTPDTSSTSTSQSSSAAVTNYPTTPIPYHKTPTTAASANILEARRIATSLVVPTFIEPTYTHGSLSTLPYRGPAAMAVLFGSSPMPSVAQRAGMVTGFSSARSDSSNSAFIVAAFEFGSAALAKAAAPALAAAAADKAHDQGKAAVPGYPAASGWYGAFDDKTAYFQTFLAQGPLVLYVYLSGEKLSAAQQAALANKTLRTETAAMAKFVPTPKAKLMDLPIDPDGLLAHTLPNVGDNASVNDGLVTSAAQLHYDTDPIGTRALFAKAGVDEVADGRVSVYRAKDPAGAAMVRDGFVAFVRKSESGMQNYRLTAAVPGAKCVQDPLGSSYYCVGVQGRYAFEINAKSEADVNAAATAEYALLKAF